MLTLVLEPMLEQVLERALPWKLALPLNALQADSHSQVGTRTITGLALELAKKKKKKAASNSGVDASVRAGVNLSCGAGLNSVARAENGTGYSRGSGAEAGGSID